jgi:2-iminobutanoate/2-iminopropanoate deaminase
MIRKPEKTYGSAERRSHTLRRFVMPKEVIKMSGNPHGPPGMLRPYSAAVRAGDFIFVSGFHGGGSNQETGEKYDTIEAQTRQCLEKIRHALEAGGASLEDVVKVTVYTHSAEDFDRMNAAYSEYFPKDPPARSAIVTQFVRQGMLIQIDCVAYKPKSDVPRNHD